MSEKTDTRKAMDSWVSKMSDEEAMEEFKRIKFDAFKLSNIKALEMWFNAHGSLAPPIRWDDRILDYVWLNRKERRARARQSDNRKRTAGSDPGKRETDQKDPGTGSQDQSP